MTNIILASPRWYCAWVDRAIGMLDDIISAHPGETIYVNHEIVHNKFIVNYFERKWVIFSDDLGAIPTGSIMVFSAHWVAPSFVKKAKDKWLRTLDASCPLVIKVHNEAKKFIADGYKIIYIWKKTHQEAIWVADNDLENIFVVGNKAEADELEFTPGQKLALLNQTTLSVDDTKELIEYVQWLYPQIQLPGFSDICYAKNSSNSTKLCLIGERAGIASLLIDTPSEIPDDFLFWVDNLAISSGASVPDNLVQDVIDSLKKKWAKFLKEIVTKEEKMIFPYKLDLQ